MTQQEITNKLTDIIRDILDDETIMLTQETSADDIEGWDSLAHINIIVAVEKEFGVKFTLTELSKLFNFGDMIDFVTDKCSRE